MISRSDLTGLLLSAQQSLSTGHAGLDAGRTDPRWRHGQRPPQLFSGPHELRRRIRAVRPRGRFAKRLQNRASEFRRARARQVESQVSSITGCGAAWLARLTGGQEVPGSNPGSPTIISACHEPYQRMVQTPAPSRCSRNAHKRARQGLADGH